MDIVGHFEKETTFLKNKQWKGKYHIFYFGPMFWEWCHENRAMFLDLVFDCMWILGSFLKLFFQYYFSAIDKIFHVLELYLSKIESTYIDRYVKGQHFWKQIF